MEAVTQIPNSILIFNTTIYKNFSKCQLHIRQN